MFKEYLVKLYDQDDAFKTTLLNSKIASSINFSRSINSWYGEFRIDYNEDHETWTFDLFDIVKVYYSWSLIYRWYVDSYTHVLKDSMEMVEVRVVGIQAILTKLIYESWSTKTFTKSAVDPSAIISEILTYANTARWATLFNTTISSYWTNVSISFDYDTCWDAIKKVIDTTWWYVDFLADWSVVFAAINTASADHTLTYKKHIVEYEREYSSKDMANDVTIEYSWWSTVNDTDATSQTSYWVLEYYVNDSRLQNSTTADERAAAEIVNRKDPKEKTIITVNDQYDLESINIGDNVQIRNKPSDTTIKPIKRIDYKENIAILYLDDYDSIEKSLSLLQW